MQNGKKPSLNYGLFHIGVTQFCVEKLNDKVHSSGMHTFANHTITIAAGGHKEYQRFITEGLFAVSWWRKNSDNGYNTSLMNVNFYENTGFNLLPPALNVSLFPFAGFGVGVNRLNTYRTSASLGEALSTTLPQTDIKQGMILFNAGLGTDLTIPSPTKKCGFTVGVRGGYQLPLYETKWHSGRTVISETPDLQPKGFYVNFVTGGWNNGHEVKCGSK